MKAHNFFASPKVEGEIREEMEKYSYLVGKKVQAISTKEAPEDEELEEETFTIVGLTTQQYTTKVYAVLKSDECCVAVSVEVGIIGKERRNYFYNPGFLFKLLDE